MTLAKNLKRAKFKMMANVSVSPLRLHQAEKVHEDFGIATFKNEEHSNFYSTMRICYVSAQFTILSGAWRSRVNRSWPIRIFFAFVMTHQFLELLVGISRECT